MAELRESAITNFDADPTSLVCRRCSDREPASWEIPASWVSVQPLDTNINYHLGNTIHTSDVEALLGFFKSDSSSNSPFCASELVESRV